MIADHLETFLVSCEADPGAKGLPAYVQREFYDYLQCGILAHGFLRLGCDNCFGVRAERPGDIRGAIAAALASGRPAIMDALTDPEDSDSERTRPWRAY